MTTLLAERHCTPELASMEARLYRASGVESSDPSTKVEGAEYVDGLGDGYFIISLSVSGLPTQGRQCRL